MANYKERVQRYNETECSLLASLIIAKIDTVLPDGVTVTVDQGENLLTDIKNEYGEILLRVFNHISPERIIEQLVKLRK